MQGRLQAAFFAFLFFGLVTGVIQGWTTGSVIIGLAVGAVSGAAFALCMLIFALVVRRFRTFGIREVGGWAPDEVILRSDDANIMRRGFAEGGKLFLTNKRLRFCSHRASVEAGEYSFPLRSITLIEPCRTLGIVPNGLRVALNDGRSITFVVYNRAQWVAEAARQLGSR
jgi:hypothetical protein